MAKILPLPLRDGESSPSAPPPAPDASVKQRWQFRRNLVIYLAYRQGFSRKFLAEVFDLHRSKVAEIINELSFYDKTEIPRHPLLGNDATLAAPSLAPPKATAGQRWRYRRNLLIHMAHRRGFSQRFIADVFDLPRSRIAEIIKEFSMNQKYQFENQFLPGEPPPGFGFGTTSRG